MIKVLKDKGVPVTPKEVALLFAKYDENKDGKVTFEEVSLHI